MNNGRKNQFPSSNFLQTIEIIFLIWYLKNLDYCSMKKSQMEISVSSRDTFKTFTGTNSRLNKYER
jgi:hypothetical protein